jgi:molecular chaperone DnaJ
LHYRAQLSFVEAALGSEVEIPTLNSATRLTIPSGTQPGAAFRIPGEGMPGLRGNSRGDLVVEVELKTPTNLTSKQEKLLKEFLKLTEQDSSKAK